MLLAWTTLTALATTPTLDFSSPPACPDSDRFADEVSARVGHVPFQPGGEPMVVRIADGSEFLGTVEWGGGTKVVRGATCPEVFEGLVSAVAVLLDAPAAPAKPAPARGSDTSGKVSVSFVSSKPEVTIAVVDGRGSGVGTGAGGTVVTSAIFTRDLCVAPCTVEVEAGMHEFIGYGRGYRSVSGKFSLEDQSATIRTEPKSSGPAVGGYLLEVLGMMGLITFGSVALTDALLTDEPPLVPGSIVALGTAGSGAALAGGVGLMISTRGKMEQEPTTVAVSGRF